MGCSPSKTRVEGLKKRQRGGSDEKKCAKQPGESFLASAARIMGRPGQKDPRSIKTLPKSKLSEKAKLVNPKLGMISKDRSRNPHSPVAPKRGQIPTKLRGRKAPLQKSLGKVSLTKPQGPNVPKSGPIAKRRGSPKAAMIKSKLSVRKRPTNSYKTRTQGGLRKPPGLVGLKSATAAKLSLLKGIGAKGRKDLPRLTGQKDRATQPIKEESQSFKGKISMKIPGRGSKLPRFTGILRTKAVENKVSQKETGIESVAPAKRDQNEPRAFESPVTMGKKPNEPSLQIPATQNRPPNVKISVSNNLNAEDMEIPPRLKLVQKQQAEGSARLGQLPIGDSPGQGKQPPTRENGFGPGAKQTNVRLQNLVPFQEGLEQESFIVDGVHEGMQNINRKKLEQHQLGSQHPPAPIKPGTVGHGGLDGKIGLQNLPRQYETLGSLSTRQGELNDKLIREKLQAPRQQDLGNLAIKQGALNDDESLLKFRQQEPTLRKFALGPNGLEGEVGPRQQSRQQDAVLEKPAVSSEVHVNSAMGMKNLPQQQTASLGKLTARQGSSGVEDDMDFRKLRQGGLDGEAQLVMLPRQKQDTLGKWTTRQGALRGEITLEKMFPMSDAFGQNQQPPPERELVNTHVSKACSLDSSVEKEWEQATHMTYDPRLKLVGKRFIDGVVGGVHTKDFDKLEGAIQQRGARGADKKSSGSGIKSSEKSRDLLSDIRDTFGLSYRSARGHSSRDLSRKLDTFSKEPFYRRSESRTRQRRSSEPDRFVDYCDEKLGCVPFLQRIFPV